MRVVPVRMRSPVSALVELKISAGSPPSAVRLRQVASPWSGLMPEARQAPLPFALQLAAAVARRRQPGTAAARGANRDRPAPRRADRATNARQHRPPRADCRRGRRAWGDRRRRNQDGEAAAGDTAEQPDVGGKADAATAQLRISFPAQFLEARQYPRRPGRRPNAAASRRHHDDHLAIAHHFRRVGCVRRRSVLARKNREVMLIDGTHVIK